MPLALSFRAGQLFMDAPISSVEATPMVQLVQCQAPDPTVPNFFMDDMRDLHLKT